MKKAIERVTDVLKGVSTLDTIIRNLAVILLVLIIMAALVGAVRGGHSTLDIVDPSFNPQIQTLALSCKSVDQIVPLPDGKMLVAGIFNTYNGQPVSSGLVRLNADQTLDTTFNANLPSGAVKNMILQPDGKILIDVAHPTISGLYRLNPDGSADTTFNASGAGGLWAIDASGRIIVGQGSFGLRRLLSNGSFDPTFNFQTPGNIFQVNAVTTQNNKIIYSYIGGTAATIQRFNENGTIDSTFNQRNFYVKSMLVQPDGKIVVLGQTSLIRLNADGSDDTGFTVTTFPVPPGFRHVMGLSADGKISVAFYSGSNQTHQIRKFLPNGVEDSSFTPYTSGGFYTLAVQSDGGVLIGDSDGADGFCTEHPFRNDFVRLLPNGSPDPTFNPGGIGFQMFAPSSVNAINVQPDGKIIIGGKFKLVNNVPRYGIARINADSTIDPTFQINTSGAGNYFSNVGVFSNIHTQSDGKIVATGSFNYVVNGVGRGGLVRLNPDGSIDPTFILDNGLGLANRKFRTYTNGKLLVANGSAPVRLLINGEQDNTFNPFPYPGNSVNINDLEIQPDGKIIIGGELTEIINNTTIYKSFLTRLNADGSLDTTFQSREQLDRAVRAFVLQPNGKIVISETTTNSLETFQTNVLRLNADGSVDPTFNAGTGANGQVNAMLLLTTGRIFVGGKFTNFNGQPRANLVQLNADGTVFTPVYNLNDEVLSLAVDSTGRVFVGGNFTTVIAGNSSAPRSYVAALIDAQPSATRFDFDGDGRADLGVFSAADGRWSILNSRNYQTVWTNFGLSEDKTAAADFDGDGKTDIAVFRPSEGTWYLLRSRDGFGAVPWGADGDKPIAGDFDGDRKADLAVWRPSSAVWWILKSSDGEASAVNFGLPGDVPLSHADFDGDRRTDIAVWRPSDGHFYWLASGSANQFNAVHFGQNGDIPAPADYNGDGKTDLVVYRPSEGNWYQYLTTPTGEYTFTVVSFGLSQDEPVAADYDGDGKTDIAVRRGDAWHIRHSALGYSVQTFGDVNARAVASFPIQ
jgi:uncharacterized delta-60 repeat protein